VLNSLDAVPVSVEELTQFIGLPAGELERALLSLQLRGLVQITPQGYIRAAPRSGPRGLESGTDR
jgi:predicted Rossmann fold nucleotide-binding protein DprA/Smf involved in DNA uptake